MVCGHADKFNDKPKYSYFKYYSSRGLSLKYLLHNALFLDQLVRHLECLERDRFLQFYRFKNLSIDAFSHSSATANEDNSIPVKQVLLYQYLVLLHQLLHVNLLVRVDSAFSQSYL